MLPHIYWTKRKNWCVSIIQPASEEQQQNDFEGIIINIFGKYLDFIRLAIRIHNIIINFSGINDNDIYKVGFG